MRTFGGPPLVTPPTHTALPWALALAACALTACGIQVRPTSNSQGEQLPSGPCSGAGCCPAKLNASAVTSPAHPSGCRYLCDPGFKNDGTPEAPACAQIGACTRDICAGRLLRTCDTSSGLLEPPQACPSGGCADGACCPPVANTTADQSTDRCIYRCDEGFRLYGVQFCVQDGKCSKDTCSGNLLRACNPETGEFRDATACASGGCADGGCCPTKPNAAAEGHDGHCTYRCAVGYKNIGNASSPNCVAIAQCTQDTCEDNQLRRCDPSTGKLDPPTPCAATGACANGRCCPAYENAIASSTGTLCRYKCAKGYLNTGTLRDPLCVKRDSLIFKMYWDPGEVYNPASLEMTMTNDPAHLQKNSFDIDCNSDGEYEFKGYTSGKFTCKYKEPVTITIRGYMQNMQISPPGRKVDIKQWGDNPWLTTENMFYYIKVKLSDPKSPNLSQTESMSAMFRRASMENVGDWDNLQYWDVSHVKDMSNMFDESPVNTDLSGWMVGSAESMSEMFSGTKDFNSDIGGWDVSKVKSMWSMFKYAKVFNQDISLWDVREVRDMAFMFHQAREFSQDLSGWKVSKVKKHSGFADGSKLETHQRPHFQ